MTTAENNKRIAKNTLLLYVRMLVTMAISLYTSRIVLATLGVNDFGIYSVVGGIVTMFACINGSMASATQRFITFALGKNDFDKLRIVFFTALHIHALISMIILLLGETVGLWFLYNKMLLPVDRMDAAFWVLQCSIFSTLIIIFCVPFNAAIIAHEKMSAFAYISILEVILKLAVVYILLAFSADKLILYSFLLLFVQVLICSCYAYYCSKYFKETKYRYVWDKQLFREMIGFAGWSMFGNVSAVLFTQGLNMLLNVFFGPVVNAARAVAVQVQNAIQQFVTNFQMALNPQITKTYAQSEMQEMHMLMYRSARFSFFLLFFLSLPVLFETNFILTLWLKNVPDYTIVFLRIMICTSLLYTIANPMMVANQATGKVKKYQVVCGTILLMILPISYILLRLGCPAYSVFVVHLVMESIAQITRMMLLRPLIHIGVMDYFRNIYSKIVLVVVVSLIFPSIVYINMQDDVIRFFVICLLSVVSVIVSAYQLGLSRNERQFVTDKIIILVNQLRKK